MATNEAAQGDTPRTVSLVEVARALQISDDTARRNMHILRRLGLYELPRFGRQRRFSAASLERLIEGATYTADRRQNADRRKAARVA